MLEWELVEKRGELVKKVIELVKKPSQIIKKTVQFIKKPYITTTKPKSHKKLKLKPYQKRKLLNNLTQRSLYL